MYLACVLYCEHYCDHCWMTLHYGAYEFWKTLVYALIALITCTFTGDSVCSRKDKKQSLKIIQRFHFSSSLKRMSVICAQYTPGSSDTKYIATVKGAAEILRPMVSVTCVHYVHV